MEPNERHDSQEKWIAEQDVDGDWWLVANGRSFAPCEDEESAKITAAAHNASIDRLLAKQGEEYGRGVTAGKLEALQYTPEERERYGKWVAESLGWAKQGEDSGKKEVASDSVKVTGQNEKLLPAFYCLKCRNTFRQMDGKTHRDGDVSQWCPYCGASDDHIYELSEPGAGWNVYSSCLRQTSAAIRGRERQDAGDGFREIRGSI